MSCCTMLNGIKENTTAINSVNVIPPQSVESAPNCTVQKLKSNVTIGFQLKNSANVEVSDIIHYIILINPHGLWRNWQKGIAVLLKKLVTSSVRFTIYSLNKYNLNLQWNYQVNG